MGQPSTSATLFECASCGNLGLGRSNLQCCNGTIQAVGDGDFDIKNPTLEELLRTVFGMSKTEMDLCLCIMEGGETTVKQLADEVDYDRSVVSRHLNHLVDLGVIDKRRRIRKKGGQVYIYTPSEPDVVRRNLTGAFLSWVQEATELIESLSREKVEAMVESDIREAQWKIYKE